MHCLTRRPASLWVCLLLLTCAAPLRAQAVNLNTTSLGFSYVAISNSSSKSVRLTTTGNSPLVITSISQPSAPFAESTLAGALCHLLPATLAPRAYCTITVTFSPTSTGSFTGSVSIADNATGSPQQISVSGQGVQPVTLSPLSQSFSKITLGNSSSGQTFTLKNVQNVPLTVYSITPSASFSQTNTCPIPPSNIAAGGTCPILVTFSPSTLGLIAGTLSVAHSAIGSPTTSSLSGTGISPVTMSPTSLSFGSQNMGTTSTGKTIQVTNVQPVPLSITSIQATGNFSETNSCPATLAAGMGCPVIVKFSPTASGPLTGQLLINDGALGRPQTATLTVTSTPVLTSLMLPPPTAPTLVNSTS